MRRLAKNLDLPKKPLTCGGACHGTMTQWFNKHHTRARRSPSSTARRAPVSCADG